MKLENFYFTTIDWEKIPLEIRKGEIGTATWRVVMMNNIRVRMVEYSPGYKADHWCQKGHVLHCLEGELQTELADGRTFNLSTGMTYFVGDDNEPHRSSTHAGCKLFIVD